MTMDSAQLAAVDCVVRYGSFEKAARALHVTPSAISQRIRTLEDRLGVVLVVRGQPCTATAAGERLCRHAEEVGLLEHRALADLGALKAQANPPMLRAAISADSLATWFVEALTAIDGIFVDVVLDNEDHSADWLRRGEVSAAVSVATAPVQGCGHRALGALRYLPTASPAFVDRWFAHGVNSQALASAPCLEFNAKDQLQARWLRQHIGAMETPLGHRLPSSNAFVDAALAGVGWGMNPEPLVRPYLAAGRLVELLPGRALDVPLLWQWSRVIEPALGPITEAVVEAARQQLVPAA